MGTYGQLTAQGARLLRMAREEIRRHPKSFDMAIWDCGTTACVAGHVVRASGGKQKLWRGTPETACELLGFTPFVALGLAEQEHPLGKLFSPRSWYLRFGVLSKTQTPENAAIYINEFLWSQGFPPDEVGGEIQAVVERREDEEVTVCAVNNE